MCFFSIIFIDAIVFKHLLNPNNNRIDNVILKFLGWKSVGIWQYDDPETNNIRKLVSLLYILIFYNLFILNVLLSFCNILCIQVFLMYMEGSDFPFSNCRFIVLICKVCDI